MLAVDHLVWAVPDLDAGIALFEEMSGIRARPGGKHPGMGTRNALISLGEAVYLEIIGPDSAPGEYRNPRVFRIDDVSEPRLVTWAARCDDIEKTAALELPGAVTPGKVLSGSRTRPDGVRLTWRLTDPYTEIADGVFPFLIDWGDTLHPASDAPAGATLTKLQAGHPDSARVREMFVAAGIEVPVVDADSPSLVATLDTPRGSVELR